MNYVLTVAGTQAGTGLGGYSGELSITPVPEPETWLMLMAGLSAIGFVARRRRLQPEVAIPRPILFA